MDKNALMEEFSYLDNTGKLAVYKAYMMGLNDGKESSWKEVNEIFGKGCEMGKDFVLEQLKELIDKLEHLKENRHE